MGYVRDHFRSRGFASAVQQVCWKIWCVARSVKSYILAQQEYRVQQPTGRNVRPRVMLNDRCRRAFVDSRAALLCCNEEWESRRDDTSESLRIGGKWVQASQGKRLRGGPLNTAQRSWQFPYMQMHGAQWWTTFDSSYLEFLRFWESTLMTYGRPKIFE